MRVVSSLLPSGVSSSIDANLNLTNVVYNIFSSERVLEIEFFDANGTKFAYLNTVKGANLNLVTDVHLPMPKFWNRLTVTGGSLILTGIQSKDNGLEIRAEAQLIPLHSRSRRSNMESVRVKTIRILVNDANTPQGSFHLGCFSAILN